MPVVSRNIWTNGRKFMGNLVPGLLSFPFAATGLWLWSPDEPLAIMPLALLAAFPLCGWFALAFFGLWSNGAMRTELGQRFGRERGAASGSVLFAGIARPGFRSLLDPHEDIALLIFYPEELEVYGEKLQFRVQRSHIQRVALRPNTHSWIGLGGWIAFECGEQSFVAESRQNDALIANRWERKRLAKGLERWRETGVI